MRLDIEPASALVTGGLLQCAGGDFCNPPSVGTSSLLFLSLTPRCRELSLAMTRLLLAPPGALTRLHTPERNTHMCIAQARGAAAAAAFPCCCSQRRLKASGTTLELFQHVIADSRAAPGGNVRPVKHGGERARRVVPTTKYLLRPRVPAISTRMQQHRNTTSIFALALILLLQVQAIYGNKALSGQSEFNPFRPDFEAFPLAR